MTKLEVFDPPMCCNTGICGASTDETLLVFASNLEWLKAQGINVNRYGLAFNPAKFINTEAVKNAICNSGNSCLPIIIIDEKIVSQKKYPSRKELALLCNIQYNEDEAPAIHRESHCCCGVDCDCGAITFPEGACPAKNECDCSNAPAEDNCQCQVSNENRENPEEKNEAYNMMFVSIVLVLAAVIALKIIF